MSPRHPFLTDDWVRAARALRAEYGDRLGAVPGPIRMNTVITDSPHHDGPVLGHIDTANGDLIIDEGHLANPDLTITIDYATAGAAFVTRDLQAVMQAVFAGKILVEGDVMKLMMLQAHAPSADEIEMYQRLDALTARD